MARYWVPGGNGSWASTTNWSTTSGGASGASVPSTGDDVFFDVNSGSSAYTVNVNSSGQTCRDFTVTSDAATYMTFAGTWGFAVRGNFILSSGMNFTYSSTISFVQGAGTLDIDTQGVAMPCTVTITPSNNASVYNMQSALNLTGFSSALNILRGTFNTNGYSITTNRFVSTGTTSRIINPSSSTITLTGVGSGSSAPLNFGGFNLTVYEGTATWVFAGGSSSTNREAITAGVNFSNWAVQTLGTGELHVKGGGQWLGTFSINPGRTVKFDKNIGISIVNPQWVGTAGNLITINTIDGLDQFTVISGLGQIVSCDYLNLTNCHAFETNTWYAGANSTNGGNNNNWIFTAPPSGPAYDSVDGVPASGIAEFDRVAWSDISTIK